MGDRHLLFVVRVAAIDFGRTKKQAGFLFALDAAVPIHLDVRVAGIRFIPSTVEFIFEA